MTKTLAIFGAGPALGLSLARRFGREGFRVALVARTTENLDALVAELGRDGIEASGFVADVYEPAQIATAVAAIGRIDAVAFNPGGGNMGEGIASVLDVDPGNLRLILDRFVVSAVALVRAVLPEMTERGDGAILFTAGQSGLHPAPFLGNAGMAQAALRNYFHNLNSVLTEKGVYVGAVNVGALIEGSVPHRTLTAGPLDFEPEVIHPDVFADAFWKLYATREAPEALVGSFGR
ncbi:SDR family NAD(P)-dependent oxidoreductase [Amycolatopsis regifaucium]|uniref:Short chain dehydrogenase n=1 Tax=Amycolatopsis regifaucium TaxID=546365 RepID=A0A154MHP6_9PSEU|nr:SDR family NAD(P)-dependent oxidoreductase [Amycolatopsis regifaucium]KZB83922.1 short chain dehydrogenase [Amycolatopsis regifaucium]OKA06636.1 short chain dehydrogenase [Amycolatopsis regifaucium]SFH22378.1 short chain dehydrogenase [Amycolatopsis regifaucium]